MKTIDVQFIETGFNSMVTDGLVSVSELYSLNFNGPVFFKAVYQNYTLRYTCQKNDLAFWDFRDSLYLLHLWMSMTKLGNL